MRGIFRAVCGDISWRPPGWILWIGRPFKLHPVRAILALLLLIALVTGGWQGWRWFKHRPQPRTVSARVDAPGVTPIKKIEKREWPVLEIKFGAPVAPLDNLRRVVTTGVRMEPPLPGSWEWKTDDRLVFTPKDDWPADTALRIELDRTALRPATLLERYDFKTRTAPFTGRVLQIEFYQDPRNPALKQVTATLEFTHRVDRAEIERRLSAEMVGGSKVFNPEKKDGPRYTLEAGEQQRIYYFRTSPLTLPEREDFLQLVLRAGIPTLQGGAVTVGDYQAKVRVPDLYSFFRIDGAETMIVRNKSGEPEQFLFVRTSSAAKSAEVAKNLQAWLLPARNPNVEHPAEETSDSPEASRESSSDSDDEESEDAVETPTRRSTEQETPAFDNWGATQVDDEVLKTARPLALSAVPGAEEESKLHTFRLRLDSEGRIFLRVRKGLRAIGEFQLGDDFTSVLAVPVPGREIEIQGEGGVLALSGERKLSIKSRGLAEIQYEIARVPADQINHLVSQTNGTFSDPNFRSDVFTKDNISRIALEQQPIALKNRFEANYTTFNFGSYLRAARGDNSFQQGLFFIKARGWSRERNQEIDDTAVTRFVLVTDLGLLAKANADGTRDVFVASLKTGQPAAGVTVDILAKNGVALATGQTGADGRVSLPAVNKLTKEQQPVAYVARQGGDVAFLPYRPRDRGLDFSRFDVGGVESKSGAELDAYVFSERGVYRPGDPVHVAAIVHQRNWAGNLDGIPLQLDVVDPTGRRTRVQKFALPASGFAECEFETAPESPTGVYSFRLHLLRDGKRATLLGETEVWVKEFLPDRLKISAELSKSAARGWVTPTEMRGRIKLQNLYGTAASDRRIVGRLTLSPSAFTFESHPGWVFYDPLREKKEKVEEATVELGETKTDDNGEASFDLDLTRFANASYALTFGVEGFEAESGRSVATSASTLISDLPYVVGWKSDGNLRAIQAGADRAIRFIALDRNAQPMALGPLTLRVIEKTYVSVLTRQDNGNYKYDSVERERIARTESVQIGADGLEFSLPCREPGSFVVELFDATERRVARVQFGVIGQGAVSRPLDKTSELQIKLPRTEFRAGDFVEIGIVAPYTGCGLITLERDKVYAHQWFKADQTSTVQKIRLPADFDGTGYVNVSFIRALDSREIYSSPLSYGVVPVTVNRDGRRLPIELRTASEVKPGEPLTIKYRTDRPSQIAIFAVDKGILQVTDFRLPDPLDHFFRQAALMVATSQIVDQLLPEFSLLRSTAATGGSDAEKKKLTLNPFRRVTDKPVVFWSGVLAADKTEREVTYDVPDYFNGTLAVMAVACAPNAVGSAETKSLVRGAFVLSPGVPTFAAPGDVFDVSVTVANNVENSGDDAAVRLQLEVSPHFEIVGASALDLKVGEGKETSALFKLRVKELLGSGQLVFRAAAAGGESSQSRATMSVRPAGPFLTLVRSGNFDGERVDVPISRAMFPEFRKLQATVSALPLGLARGLQVYLHNYPNGCTEQLTSGAFAQVALADEADFGLSRAEATTHLEKVFATLQQRQNAQGGFGYWSNESSPAIDLLNVYVAHFLIEAKADGFATPAELLTKSLGNLRQMVARTPASLREARTVAYAIYVLTREGNVTTNYIVNLREWLDRRPENKAWRRDMTAVYLAGSLALLKKSDEAEKLIGEYQPGKFLLSERWDFYQPLGADSQYFAVLAGQFPDRLKRLTAADLQSFLAPIIAGRFNTMSAAYAVLALKAYSQAVKVSAPPLSISELDGTQRAIPLTLAGSAVLGRADFSDQATALRFETNGRTGGIGNFYQVVEAGFDRRPPEGIVSQGLEITREFLNAEGKPLERARVGEAITVRIRTRSMSGGAVTNVAILDLWPAGFEIANDSLTPGTGRQGMDYIDMREDRAVFFGSVGPRSQEIAFAIKPTCRGEFTVPPIAAESMYDAAIQARGLPGRITVTAP